jgi:hypothetical protein
MAGQVSSQAPLGPVRTQKVLDSRDTEVQAHVETVRLTPAQTMVQEQRSK